MQEVDMKKLLVLIGFFMILSLAGCGRSSGDDKTDADNWQNDEDYSDYSDGDSDSHDKDSDDSDFSENSYCRNEDPEDFYEVPDVIVTFGSYEQDNNLENGMEPIEWRVLKTDGGKVLMLAEKGLDGYYWNGKIERGNIWRNSLIRTWLNDDFYNTAFSSDEKKRIVLSGVFTEYQFGSAETYATPDNVFLLSSSEVEEYIPKKCSRMVFPTEYAKTTGVNLCDRDYCRDCCNGSGYGAGIWWLRNPGANGCTTVVKMDGSFDIHCEHYTSNNVVRPALWIWRGEEAECEEGTYSCNGTIRQVCRNGFWNADEICGYTCNSETLQCEECESGAYRCKGCSLQRCIDGGWEDDSECEFGCDPSKARCYTGIPIVGNLISFGSYEQDNNHENGSEPVEWRVLETDGNNILLLAERGLDVQMFDDDSSDWRESVIRAWLNIDFYNTAFTPDEWGKIVSSSVTTESKFEGTESFATVDNVFLLSQSEVERYFPESCGRLASPTEYAVANNAQTVWSAKDCNGKSSNSAAWWLRSPWQGLVTAVKVGYSGFTDYSFVNLPVMVRPALRMRSGSQSECAEGSHRCIGSVREVCRNGFWNADEICGYTCNKDTLKCDECQSGSYRCSGNKSRLCIDGGWNGGTECEKGCDSSNGKCSETGYYVGNTVTFGSYEQDNDTANGKEPIEWRILDLSGNKALMLAEKVLDAHYWNRLETQGQRWKTSEIRAWLNSDFYNTAFSSANKERIAASSILTGSEVTTDNVFLLSETEIERYFPEVCDCMADITEYAKANLAHTGISSLCSIGDPVSAEWWLRSPSEYFSEDAITVGPSCGTESGFSVSNKSVGVRPAMWVEF